MLRFRRKGKSRTPNEQHASVRDGARDHPGAGHEAAPRSAGADFRVSRTHEGGPAPAAGASAAEDQSTATGALWRADSRRLRNGLISLFVFFGLLAALLLAVPGLRSAARLIADANVAWVGGGVALELLSCASYVVLFELVFARLRRRLASRLSLSELAINSVVSAGGLGGFALGAWVLRTGGAPLRRIAERSLLLYLLTSAVNVSAVAVCGTLMGLGVLPGSSNPLLTFAPAGAALLTIVVVLGLAACARVVLQGAETSRGRWVVVLAAVSEAVEDGLRMIRARDWRLCGAVGYWLFDNLVLLVCFYAYGHTPAVSVVLMGYLLGMLANSLPIPGGLGVVEGASVGMLLLYGVRPASVVIAAVLTYRAISLWVPSIIGTIAFWGMRSEIGQPLLRQPEPRAAER
jgi:uncharacterized membrane protein YbhN (UPF0104 family)